MQYANIAVLVRISLDNNCTQTIFSAGLQKQILILNTTDFSQK